jgi:hypothetical protein
MAAYPAALTHTPAPLVDARRPGRTQAPMKNGDDLVEALTGTSGPIDAGEGDPQRARRASSMGIGREDAICGYIEIMQISPVRATMRRL